MKRREMLLTAGAAVVGLSALPLRWVAAAEKQKRKVLYFTRSLDFVHSVVDRHGKPLSYSEKILVELGGKHGIEVVCSQDGAALDGDLDQFDAFIFFTCNDLTTLGKHPQPGKPVSAAGMKKFLEAVAAGKGFVGIHSATDSFRRPDSAVTPYLAMLGGEFLIHASQQPATMKAADAKFPGMAGLGDGFKLKDEWYAFQKFAPDLRVILVQETAGMHDDPYQRPPYPATWAHMYGKGRVFYTSMGHREDVWINPKFQEVLLGGIDWAVGSAEADVTPNIAQVTPKANQLRS